MITSVFCLLIRVLKSWHVSSDNLKTPHVNMKHLNTVQMDYLASEIVKLMPCQTSSSPDLNPIENL